MPKMTMVIVITKHFKNTMATFADQDTFYGSNIHFSKILVSCYPFWFNNCMDDFDSLK